MQNGSPVTQVHLHRCHVEARLIHDPGDGFGIFHALVAQNDLLSLKTANKRDWWFHTQQSPGSHVILETVDGEASDQAMEEAAMLAAYFSKAKESSPVPVDYTRVKQLKKPVGAKPGKVIYHEYYTMIVTPDKEKCEAMRV